MSYEIVEKEDIMAKELDNRMSRMELEDKCYTLEASKRMLLKKVHHHYHPKS